jgi:hypothetical protein
MPGCTISAPGGGRSSPTSFPTDQPPSQAQLSTFKQIRLIRSDDPNASPLAKCLS